MGHYYKIKSLKDKQKLLLELFKAFHDICEKNSLIYNIFGGTFLGAIRHKGFIPWDDDIDVTMPRKDYNRLIKIIRSGKYKEWQIHAYPDENYIYPFAKFGMRGTVLTENIVKSKYNKLTLNIDIFPNDGYPDDEQLFDKYDEYEKKIILLTYRLFKIKNNIFQFLYQNVLKLVYSCVGYRYYLDKQFKLFLKYREDRELILCNGAGWGKRGKTKKEDYYDRILYDFERLKVWGMRNYNDQLVSFYGDYMTLPPKEKRVNPHDSSLFVSEKIYRKYLGEK